MTTLIDSTQTQARTVTFDTRTVASCPACARPIVDASPSCPRYAHGVTTQLWSRRAWLATLERQLETHLSSVENPSRRWDYTRALAGCEPTEAFDPNWGGLLGAIEIDARHGHYTATVEQLPNGVKATVVFHGGTTLVYMVTARPAIV